MAMQHSFGPSWAALLLIGLLVALVLAGVLVIVALATRKRDDSAGPMMEPEERQQLITDSEKRFREERGRVLDMVSSGQITAEEADRLIDTMHRQTATMACPFCAEEIQVQAVKCRHCHSTLVGPGPSQKRLAKSHDQMLAGVCGGVAEYLGIDPTLVRVGTVLIAFFVAGLPVVIIYIVGAFIMPDPV